MLLFLARPLARRAGANAVPRSTYALRPVLQLSASRRSLLIRTYASKTKAKSTASFVPGSKQLFDSEETRAEYTRAESKMATAVDWFRVEVARFEARSSGRITPDLLAPIRVEQRGQSVKLEDVALVSVKDRSMLVVTAFDEHNAKAVEQSIYAAKLPGIVPQRLDSRTFKIPIAKLTVEARNALVTTAIRLAEDVRVQIRKHHQASVKKGKYEKRSIELEEFQKLSDKHILEVDKILAQMKKTMGNK